MADDVEQMAEDHLCHTLGGVGGYVGDDDVLPAGHFEVNDVVAGGEYADVLEAWQHVEYGGIEHDFVGEHNFCALASCHYFVGCGAFVGFHFSQFFESVPSQFALADGICVEYYNSHMFAFSFAKVGKSWELGVRSWEFFQKNMSFSIRRERG